VVEVEAEVLLVIYYGPELAGLSLCVLCAEALSLCRCGWLLHSDYLPVLVVGCLVAMQVGSLDSLRLLRWMGEFDWS